MPGKFSLRKFSEINLDDPFFAPLKNDYPGNASSPSFSVWFKNKAQEGRTALVFSDDQGLGAFKGLWRHTCATVFYLPETEKRLTIIKFSISRASLTKNPIPNTGRTISGKDSDEVIQQFGASLI